MSLKVFAAPVRIRGYESIIKNPMDLGTMLAKAESGEYSDLTEIRADLDLMFANCAKFNKVTWVDSWRECGR